MARPIKQFPVWNPSRITLKRLGNINPKIRYNALRNSSSAFIKRKDVREFILKRDNFKCVQCGSTDSLEIDHINSVYSVHIGKYDIQKLNTEQNLQTLCKQCNSSKMP